MRKQKYEGPGHVRLPQIYQGLKVRGTRSKPILMSFTEALGSLTWERISEVQSNIFIFKLRKIKDQRY